MTDTRKLYRIPSKGMIGGVCAGLGEYLKADPTVIRIAFALLALAGVGSGVLIYIVMWLIVPIKPEDQLAAEPAEEEEKTE